MDKLKLYISSNTNHAEKWKKLRSSGVNVIATWIDRFTNDMGHHLAVDFTDWAQSSLNEIRQADKFILYCEEGENLQTPLAEAGAALAFGIPVYYVGPQVEIGAMIHAHPLWHNRKTLDEILANV